MKAAPEIGTAAPDFSVVDVEGEHVSLASCQGDKPVLLVLNRGFK